LILDGTLEGLQSKPYNHYAPNARREEIKVNFTSNVEGMCYGRTTRNPSVTSNQLQDKKADGSKFPENCLT